MNKIKWGIIIFNKILASIKINSFEFIYVWHQKKNSGKIYMAWVWLKKVLCENAGPMCES
jgi:hypothetical protein